MKQIQSCNERNNSRAKRGSIKCKVSKRGCASVRACVLPQLLYRDSCFQKAFFRYCMPARKRDQKFSRLRRFINPIFAEIRRIFCLSLRASRYQTCQKTAECTFNLDPAESNPGGSASTAANGVQIAQSCLIRAAIGNGMNVTQTGKKTSHRGERSPARATRVARRSVGSCVFPIDAVPPPVPGVRVSRGTLEQRPPTSQILLQQYLYTTNSRAKRGIIKCKVPNRGCACVRPCVRPPSTIIS